MVAVKRTDDWQAEDHFDKLKDVPKSVECAAAEPIANAIIFFGRQIQDQKMDTAKLPLDVSAIVLSQMNEQMPVWLASGQPKEAPSKGLIAWLAGIGIPTPICILLWFIGSSKGWW